MTHVYNPKESRKFYRSLVKHYRDNSVLRELSQELQNLPPKHIFLKNFQHSAAVFLVSAMRKLHKKPMFVLANSKEQAAYLRKDLNYLLEETKSFFFPASNKREDDFSKTENANIVKRTQFLDFLSKEHPPEYLVITYPEALLEKVVTVQELKLHSYFLKEGDDIGMNFLEELLENYDFERVPFVYEPGQFAVRGGIIDFFPFSEDYPVRLEFFDDLIEEIRYFNPISQLSHEKIKEIQIIPNIERTQMVQNKIPFLELLPNDAVFLVQDERVLRSALQKAYDKAKKIFPEDFQSRFSSPEEIMSSLRHFNTLFYEGTSGKTEAEYTWSITPQPTYDKELKLFAKELEKLHDEGYSLFITSDYEKQLRRIHRILENYLEKEIRVFCLMPSLSYGFIDNSLKIALFTDHQLFHRFHALHKKKSKEKSFKEALALKDLSSLKPGDYVVHEQHGIGKFGGITRIKTGNSYQDAIRIFFQNDDILFVPVHSLHKIYKYNSDITKKPKLSKLGSKVWANKTAKIRKKVKELSFDIVRLYAQRKLAKGFAFPKDNTQMHLLEASFYFDETEDQLKAIEEVKADMEAETPMDRLICGDVGFGKTEVAVRAAFKAFLAKKQVACLVPTTILAMQHFQTFSERLRQFGVRIEVLTRLKEKKEQREILKKLKAGEIDIIIGTHRLLSKDVHFHDLGLLIIDEEQRFGVAHKEKLKLLRANIDTLTLTATPIPRTLQLSLSGIRDISIIATPPPNRQPVQTKIITYDEEIIRDAITRELDRGGQVLFVHNNVSELDKYAVALKKLVPDAKIITTHGQMKPEELERRMGDFVQGKYDILVTTTIVESGLDMPNVNTLFVNEAHKRFGLSQLHQLRGRIGRSYRKAYCYFIAPPFGVMPPDAEKRLKTLEEFSELGSGFQIAMQDLDMRGGGDIFSAEQSGFMNEIGFEFYNKMLQDVIEELKAEMLSETPVRESPLKTRDIVIDLDFPIFIPSLYIEDTAERMHFYQEINEAESEEKIRALQRELKDRFGEIPVQVFNLLDAARIRILLKSLKIKKLATRRNTMFLYLSPEHFDVESIKKIVETLKKEEIPFGFSEKKEQIVLKVPRINSMKQILMILELLQETFSKTRIL